MESRHKRSPEEMALITELARAAVGFDTARGDVVSVQNLGFHHAQESDVPPPTFAEKAQKGIKDYSSLIRYASLLGGLLMVFLMVVRPMQKKALSMPEVIPAPLELQAPEQEVSTPSAEEDLVQRSLALKNQVTDFVRREPENSATAVRAWLQEEAL